MSSPTEQSVGAILETRGSGAGYHAMRFDSPIDTLTLHRGGDVNAFFDRIDEATSRQLWVCGYFAYELGYVLEPALAALLDDKPSSMPLAWVGLFEAPQIFDDASNALDGFDEGARCTIANLRHSMTRSEYVDGLKRIKDYLAAGDSYQVNFTQKYQFDVSGSTRRLYAALRGRQSVAYSAYLNDGKRTIISLSPELFFDRRGDEVEVKPMKGTANRGRTLHEDEEMMAWLANDAKNRAENVMIVDMIRNDLGRIARPGGVQVRRLFDVERYETLHQMTSTVTAQLRPNTSTLDCFKALFPCASVTGAPKVRTMEIISSLEKEARGVYTGSIGYFAPDGRACLNVAIRTIVVDDDHRAEMGIGSGVVYDSDPSVEYEECLMKAHFLTKEAPTFQLIETMLLASGELVLLDCHLERLRASACYFGFEYPAERIRAGLERVAERLSHRRCRLRLLLSANGEFEIESMKLGEGSAAPARVKISDVQADSRDSFLYHKTTNRPLYQEHGMVEGYDEVIFLNERGEVTEGAITNVFVDINGKRYTPPVSCGLLPGTLRRQLLESGECFERVLYTDDLYRAEAVHIGNSVIGLRRAVLGHRKCPGETEMAVPGQPAVDED